MATVALVGGTAEHKTTTLSVGTHTIWAYYAAQANWGLSSDSVGQVVNSLVVYGYAGQILSIVQTGESTFALTLKGTPGANYYLAESADVLQPMSAWTPVASSTNTAPADPGEWTQPVSLSAPRFYRLMTVNPAP